MNKYDLKRKLFRSLKSGPKTLDELQVAIGKVSKKEIQACLDRNTQWIERYGGAYRLKHVLDAPLKPAKRRDWDYAKIQEFQKVQGRPVKFMNPYIDWVPHLDQGGRGTCCGFAGAYAAWLLQLALIDPKPRMEDVQKIEYDQVVKTGACNMLVDVKHEYAPSPEGVYQICREVEKVTYPSGCYIRGVARALKDWGYNFEKSWLTSKVSTCVGKDSYPAGREACEKEASEHKAEGYAQIWSFDALKDAIWNYGCAVVAVDIHSNYEEHGKQGPFPEPNHDVIGSHALCCVGYDENYVYCLHSWRDGFSKIGGFSERYYNNSTGMAYSVIDSEDVIIGKEIYGTITCRSNVPCNFTFGNDTYENKTEQKVSWLLDKECSIYVAPIEKGKYIEQDYDIAITLTKDKPEIVLDFQFTEREDVKYKLKDVIKKMIEEILKKIKNILNK